ncbi:serine hydrolase domain-containing protein [Pseudidiomarina andamanensis]|uniref:Class C beta-lactamase-related serine hydrolase n=1 Tax=Pseudidiomarina andamanensis TaxID=1940690 RepID=A0AA92ES04_9GAMM|nr:serine hydrolase [Pseudidiomarina andamanensis]MDS0218618.1 beta-lactamase family protein [Pseudidiomarina andamanensis]QGT95483.1 class C beta-lactamase-related serine hydrolase [Pseudidiomarina andamanensis]
MKKRIVSLFVLPLAVATFAAQGQESDTTINAYAAGYVAGYTCSATFNANKSEAAIREHELTGIYSLVADKVAAMKAMVDRENKLVRVAYDNGQRERISVWRPRLGCVDLPVGATIADADKVSRPFADSAVEKDSGEPWQERQPVNHVTGNLELDGVIQKAFSKHYGAGARTTAILIATPEKIIAENYLDGFTPETSQRTWSVAKSIAASVVGAAVLHRNVDVKASANVANWQSALDPRRNITLEHLLHMASGLDSNAAGNRTDRVYMGGGRVIDTATTTALEVTPGTRWKYANNDTMLAMRAVREGFENADDYLKFPYDMLLDKIGMAHTFLETDWNDDFIMSSQVWTTARDLARLGVLHVQNGMWKGERVLPENWLTYISTPAPAQPPESSPGYGAQWWLYNERFPELPNDTIAARGNRGQFLVIIPSENLVVVRRGYDMAGEPGFNEHDFVRDVLKALK